MTDETNTAAVNLLNLAENLRDWGRHYAKQRNPVALSLFCAAAVIEEYAAVVGSEGQARTNPLSTPGGIHEMNNQHAKQQ